MNRKILISASVALACAGAGFAQAQTTGSSMNTRAEVKADTRAAKAAASIPMGEQSTPTQGKKPAAPMGSTETRAEVKADAKASGPSALAKGQISVKDQDKGPKAKMSQETRAEVKGEVKAEGKTPLAKGQVSVKDQDKGASGKP